MSIDSLRIVEDWISGKDECFEDCGSSDWMAVDPPSGNSTVLLGSSDDEVEELAGGNYSSLDVKK